MGTVSRAPWGRDWEWGLGQRDCCLLTATVRSPAVTSDQNNPLVFLPASPLWIFTFPVSSQPLSSTVSQHEALFATRWLNFTVQQLFSWRSQWLYSNWVAIMVKISWSSVYFFSVCWIHCSCGFQIKWLKWRWNEGSNGKWQKNHNPHACKRTINNETKNSNALAGASASPVCYSILLSTWVTKLLILLNALHVRWTQITTCGCRCSRKISSSSCKSALNCPVKPCCEAELHTVSRHWRTHGELQDQ